MRVIGIIGIAMCPDMIELLDRDRTIILDCTNNSAEMRNDGVVRRAEIATRQYCRRMNGHRFHDDHSGTVEGALGIIGCMALRRQAIDSHI